MRARAQPEPLVDLKAQALQQEVAQVTRAVKSGKFSAGGSAPAMGTRDAAAAPTNRLEQQLNQMQARRIALERYAPRSLSFLRTHPLGEQAVPEACSVVCMCTRWLLTSGNTRREAAKARLEEEGFQRQLEAVQKAERLAGLNAAQAGLGRLLSADTVRSTQQHANEDISFIKEHFAQLRNLVNQRENATLMEVSEAHKRVVEQFKARYMLIQQRLHSLQGLEARTPTHSLSAIPRASVYWPPGFTAPAYAR